MMDALKKMLDECVANYDTIKQDLKENYSHLKEKAKLQFNKVKEWKLDNITEDSEPDLTKVAQELLSEIQNNQSNSKQTQKVAVSSTDQSDSNDNPNQVGD